MPPSSFSSRRVALLTFLQAHHIARASAPPARAAGSSPDKKRLAHMRDVEQAGLLRACADALSGCRPDIAPASHSRRTAPSCRRAPDAARGAACVCSVSDVRSSTVRTRGARSATHGSTRAPLSSDLRDFPERDRRRVTPSVEDGKRRPAFQKFISFAVLLPESFRGGCSFGLAFGILLNVAERLPRGIIVWPRQRASRRDMRRAGIIGGSCGKSTNAGAGDSLTSAHGTSMPQQYRSDPWSSVVPRSSLGQHAARPRRRAGPRSAFRQDVMLGVEAAEFLRQREGVVAQDVRRAAWPRPPAIACRAASAAAATARAPPARRTTGAGGLQALRLAPCAGSIGCAPPRIADRDRSCLRSA